MPALAKLCASLAILWVACGCEPDGEEIPETSVPTLAVAVPEVIRELRHGDVLYTVHSISFSPDGKILASGSGNPLGADGKIELWDVQTGELERALAQRTVHAVAFSPDGKILMSATEGKEGIFEGAVEIWDTQRWELTQSLKGPIQNVKSITISPDGKMVGGAGSEIWQTYPARQLEAPGYLIAWNRQQERVKWLQKSPNGSDGSVYSVAFSPDGEILASGDDGGVKLWESQTGKLKRKLPGQGRQKVSFSPDGDILASGDVDGAVILWNTQTWKQRRTLTKHEYEIRSVAFSPDSKMLATGSLDKKIKLWDVSTGKLMYTICEDCGVVNSVAFSPDGKILASGGYEGTVKLWDVGTGGN